MKKMIGMTAAFLVFLVPQVLAGTLSGKAMFTGTAPAERKISMDADPTCAGLNPEPVFVEDVVVNADGTLRNVFVYVKEGLAGPFEKPSTPASINQQGCRYHPHVFGMQVGQDLEILNSDATLHNVHGMPLNTKEFNLGMPIQGMKLKRKFDKEEVMVKFKCDVHPWMNAYIGVLPHPFFSVTGDDGAFAIQNLPAGSYVVEAWHEKYGVQTQQITVDEAGAAAADFTFAG